MLGLTTDNAKNNDTFVTALLRKQVLGDREAHQRCFAHVINLGAQEAIKDMKVCQTFVKQRVILRVCALESRPSVIPRTKWINSENTVSTAVSTF